MRNSITPLGSLCILAIYLAFAAPCRAQNADGGESEADLANQLSNPVASLISVPFQNNLDFGSNSSTRIRWLMNVQPVIPFTLNQNWNLITRTIMPVQFREMGSPTDDLFGLGDTSESLFLSPRGGSIIWGVGPIVQVPTATETALGSGKLSMGPTAVVLQQNSGWTYGVLANQLWSVAGHDKRPGVNATFLQPFLVYNWKSGFGLGLNTETTYDWNAGQATVLINVFATQVLKIGTQPISIQGGVRYYAARPNGGPDWGLRLALVLLFPK
ncbi:MAG TPA: transporter [Xanthobacteraceae bacterium]